MVIEDGLLPPDLERLLDPYPLLNEFREAGRVRPATIAHGMRVWLVTGYAEAVAALTDPRLSASPVHAIERGNPALASLRGREGWLVKEMTMSDPPDHTRLRRLVSGAFTPRRVAALRPDVERIADGLIEEIAPAGEADLVAEFALPLSLQVICRLLGVPYADHERFRGWITRILQWPTDDRAVRETGAAHMAIMDYLRELLAEKSRRPSDDLLGDLLAVRDQDDRLSHTELVVMAKLLLMAGHETTAGLVANGMALLLRAPDQLRLLRRDPGLVRPAIEELLRLEGPTILGTFRYTTEEIELGEVTVPEGEIVCICLSAANRDPRRFERPDVLDLTRRDNAHLGFSHGIHYCMGAALAREEAEIGFVRLLTRLPGLRLAVDPERLEWRRRIRTLAALPVTFTPGPVRPAEESGESG